MFYKTTNNLYSITFFQGRPFLQFRVAFKVNSVYKFVKYSLQKTDIQVGEILLSTDNLAVPLTRQSYQIFGKMQDLNSAHGRKMSARYSFYDYPQLTRRDEGASPYWNISVRRKDVIHDLTRFSSSLPSYSMLPMARNGCDPYPLFSLLPSC